MFRQHLKGQETSDALLKNMAFNCPRKLHVINASIIKISLQRRRFFSVSFTWTHRFSLMSLFHLTHIPPSPHHRFSFLLWCSLISESKGSGWNRKECASALTEIKLANAKSGVQLRSKCTVHSSVFRLQTAWLQFHSIAAHAGIYCYVSPSMPQETQKPH